MLQYALEFSRYLSQIFQTTVDLDNHSKDNFPSKATTGAYLDKIQHDIDMGSLSLRKANNANRRGGVAAPGA